MKKSMKRLFTNRDIAGGNGRLAIICTYCDGDGTVDKNGNPPSSGTAYGETFKCSECKGTGIERMVAP